MKPSCCPRRLLSCLLALGAVLHYAPVHQVQAQAAPATNAQPPVAPETAPSNDPVELYRSAFVAFKTGDLSTAHTLATQAAAASPDSPRPLLLQGRIALARGEFTQAESFFRAAHKLDRSSPEPFRYLGDLAFAQRQWARARAEYQAYLQAQPRNQDIRLKLLYTWLGENRVEEAQRELQQLDPLDERHPAYYFAQAALHWNDQQNDRGQRALDQARTLYGNLRCDEFLPDLFFLFAKGS